LTCVNIIWNGFLFVVQVKLATTIPNQNTVSWIFYGMCHMFNLFVLLTVSFLLSWRAINQYFDLQVLIRVWNIKERMVL